MFVSGVDILWKEFLLKLIKAFQEKKIVYFVQNL